MFRCHGSDLIGMQKFSNNNYVCVKESSTQKLIDRGYGYLAGYESGVCYSQWTETEEKLTEHKAGIDCYITHHPQFLIRNGIPETLRYSLYAGDDIDPPILYYTGYFLSEDKRYNISVVWWKDIIMKEFSITERYVENAKDVLQLR